MIVCLKDLLNIEVKNQDHSNIYDISEYDISILFFITRNTLVFLIFLYIFLQFYLKFVEFICAISVDMC
jgi:hypothetical protein